jgi:hypothetical protein
MPSPRQWLLLLGGKTEISLSKENFFAAQKNCSAKMWRRKLWKLSQAAAPETGGEQPDQGVTVCDSLLGEFKISVAQLFSSTAEIHRPRGNSHEATGISRFARDWVTFSTRSTALHQPSALTLRSSSA